MMAINVQLVIILYRRPVQGECCLSPQDWAVEMDGLEEAEYPS